MVFKFKSEKVGEAKVNIASPIAPVATTKQKRNNWKENWDIIFAQTFFLICTVCLWMGLFLIIKLEITEQTFVKASRSFNLPTMDWNIGPAVYLMLWTSVIKLEWDAVCFTSFYFLLVKGTTNPIKGLLDRTDLPGFFRLSFTWYLFYWALCSVFLCLIDGLVLWKICKLDTHLQIHNLFLLQMLSCFWILGFNLELYITKKQRNLGKGNLECVPKV